MKDGIVEEMKTMKSILGKDFAVAERCASLLLDKVSINVVNTVLTQIKLMKICKGITRELDMFDVSKMLSSL